MLRGTKKINGTGRGERKSGQDKGRVRGEKRRVERAEEEWEGAEERGAGCRTQWIGSKCITHLHENGLTVNLYNRDRREASGKWRKREVMEMEREENS